LEKLALEDKAGLGDLPMISIIIPCYNEASHIERTVTSVLSQDYPAEKMEVLIVDGMSDDGTLDVVRRVAPANPDAPERTQQGCRLIMLQNPSRIVPAALNIGLKNAHGNFIFRLDGHSEMGPGYVRACVEKLRNHAEAACVGGPSVAVGEGFIGNAYALALSSPFGVGGGTFRTLRSESYVDTVAFGCYPRRVFEEVGAFDSQLERNQDIDFNARLGKAGYKQLIIPEVQTYYHAPGSWRKIVRQNYMNGYWNTKMLDKMVATLSWRHFIPLMFVFSILLLAVGALISVKILYLLFGIIMLYAVAACVATVVVAYRSRRAAAALLPFLFPAMHLSYGFGSLAGLVRFFFARGWSTAK
jgi:succinoglycan biosynthesis protein ExoA